MTLNFPTGGKDDQISLSPNPTLQIIIFHDLSRVIKPTSLRSQLPANTVQRGYKPKIDLFEFGSFSYRKRGESLIFGSFASFWCKYETKFWNMRLSLETKRDQNDKKGPIFAFNPRSTVCITAAWVLF